MAVRYHTLGNRLARDLWQSYTRGHGGYTSGVLGKSQQNTHQVRQSRRGISHALEVRQGGGRSVEKDMRLWYFSVIFLKLSHSLSLHFVFSYIVQVIRYHTQSSCSFLTYSLIPFLSLSLLFIPIKVPCRLV
ncbi:unnamed protein product [Tuber aestivum]|uniref:Uncharacterized protein n=1 Tax=Tuber aestivum TaxID=59557 RepID=A0A292PRG8_9PEZI|nr:unnamed protein product [Tuber aestivum]